MLQGTKFVVRTDHKALEHFMRQRNLSPGQHRWIDTLSEFEFDIQYIPGETNGFADALSRVYSDEPKGIIRSETEFVDEGEDSKTATSPKVHPVYVEASLLELMNAIVTRRSSRLAEKPTPRYKETRDREPRSLDDRAKTPRAQTRNSRRKPGRRQQTPNVQTTRAPLKIRRSLETCSSRFRAP